MTNEEYLASLEPDENTVTVSREEYKSLLREHKLLNKLVEISPMARRALENMVDKEATENA